MQKGIDKLTAFLEDSLDASFTADEYMTQYTTIYNMCTQRSPHEFSEQLYERYKNAFVSYLRDQVRVPLLGQRACCPLVGRGPRHSAALALPLWYPWDAKLYPCLRRCYQS